MILYERLNYQTVYEAVSLFLIQQRSLDQIM